MRTLMLQALIAGLNPRQSLVAENLALRSQIDDLQLILADPRLDGYSIEP